jgi:hypothetical protein
MSSLSSNDDIEDQVVEALSYNVDQAIVMVKAEMEGPSRRQLRLRRRYTHERLYRDYFADDHVYP